MAEIRRMFTPEFRNRLDAIIPFAGLSREIILRVVDKFLMQLEDQLHERRVAAVFTGSCATTWPRKASIRSWARVPCSA